MLRVQNSLLDMGQANAEAQFRIRLRAHLDKHHPEFLPLFPEKIADWILSNMIARCRAFGATWESNIAKLCDMMETLAPNILLMPAIYARIHPAFCREGPEHPLAVDRRIRVFEDTLTAEDWRAVTDARSDLALYTPPELDAHPLVERISFALRILYGDKVSDQTAPAWAADALATAENLGLATREDAALPLAGWKLLRPDLTPADWQAEQGIDTLDRLRRKLRQETGRRV